MIRSYFALVILAFVPSLRALAECGASPTRVVTVQTEPFSWHEVILSNPSTVNQTVQVQIDAKGTEKIFNAVRGTAPAFGMCSLLSGACSYIAPSGSALTCSGAPNYKSCSGSTTINAGQMYRFGFGSEVDLNTSSNGYSAAHYNDPAAGITTQITVCGNAGFILGSITSFEDVANSYMKFPIAGGRPF